MKSTKLKMAALGVIAAIGLFAFSTFGTGTIKGTVSPTNSINNVLAISGNDTVKAIIHDDSFDFVGIKSGTYRLVIEAMAPYKNFVKDGVVVTDDKTTDVGVLTLQQ
jgi:hypothetical protein